MSGPKSPHSPQVTDEDLVTAVREQCAKHSVPVVPTKTVGDAKGIEVTDQTVKRRLEDISGVNTMQVGTGHIWWVPEDEARGAVDMESIYLEEIDPEDLPRELIEQHPEGPPTSWAKLEQRGANGVWLSAFSFFTGLIITSLGNAGLLPIDITEPIGPILGIGGFAMFIVGMIFMVIGSFLDKRGVRSWEILLDDVIQPFRNRMAEVLSTE
jgi:hypothetical protein